MENKKITFKDLNGNLKILVVFGYIGLVFNIIYFLIAGVIFILGLV